MPDYLSDSKQTSNLSADFNKNFQYNIFRKPVTLFRAEGWTDRHEEINSRFSTFCQRVEKTNIVTER
jgi:hypothetical protein